MVKINETYQKYIAYLYKNTDDDISPDLILDTDFRQIVHSILYLRDRKRSVTIDEIYLISGSQCKLDYSDIETILESFDDFSNIDEIKSIIKSEYTKSEALKDVENIVQAITDGSILDSTQTLKWISNIQSNIESLYKPSEFKSMGEALKEHKLELLLRQDPSYKKTTGMPELDRNLLVPFAPTTITTFFARSGTGKSAFILASLLGVLNRNYPTLVVSLENHYFNYIDRSIAQIEGFDMKVLFEKIPEHLQAKINRAYDILGEYENCLFYYKETISIAQLDSLIAKSQDYLHKIKKIGNDGYINVVLDLGTMISDFHPANPNNVEMAINKLNGLALKRHVHFANVVQANENEERREKLTFDTPGKAFDHQVGRSGVKNGSEIFNRSRVVFELTRPLDLLKKTSLAYELTKDSIGDVLQVHCIKQNNGQTGWTERFLFGGANYRFNSFKMEDKELFEKIKEIDKAVSESKSKTDKNRGKKDSE